MSTIEIKLLHLNEQTQPLLWRLIEQNPGKFHWKKNKEYTVQLPNGDAQVITLSESLLKRYRKPGKTREFRYEIVNDVRLGRGAFGWIVTSLATLIPNPVDQTFRYSRDQVYLPRRQARRVIKFVKYRDKAHPLESEMQHEAELLIQADNMKSKPFVMIKPNHAALVMEHLGGITLDALLHKYKAGEFNLTIDIRFELSIAFWEALRTQVTERGLIHKDIKPENVMVDIIEGKFKMTIMDFGLSRRADDPTLNTVDKGCGTHGYAPPEFYGEDPNGFKVSPASDVFSGGVCIERIWTGGKKGLFQNLGNFELSSSATGIVHLLDATLCENPEERISAKAALEQFRHLHEEYHRRLDNYPDQFKRLKQWIETQNWEVKKPQRRKRSIMTEQCAKRVPFHVYELCKQVYPLLAKKNLTLADYEIAEKRILSIGKKAARSLSFFRKASTKKEYSNFKGVKSLEALLQNLNPLDPQTQLNVR